jgi:hypothetical protein
MSKQLFYQPESGLNMYKSIESVKFIEKSCHSVSFYALFGVLIPLIIICINFIMIKWRVANMREKINDNFSEESMQDVAQR